VSQRQRSLSVRGQDNDAIRHATPNLMINPIPHATHYRICLASRNTRGDLQKAWAVLCSVKPQGLASASQTDWLLGFDSSFAFSLPDYCNHARAYLDLAYTVHLSNGLSLRQPKDYLVSSFRAALRHLTYTHHTIEFVDSLR
jgi:hypothetical protein